MFYHFQLLKTKFLTGHFRVAIFLDNNLLNVLSNFLKTGGQKSSFRGKFTTIMLDGWTNSISGKHHICYMLFASKVFYWNSIECTDKSADNLFVETEKVVKTLMDQGANVICAVTDNAANMQKSLRKINEKCPKIVIIGCIVHPLNLLMGDVWKKKLRMRKERDNLLTHSFRKG